MGSQEAKKARRYVSLSSAFDPVFALSLLICRLEQSAWCFDLHIPAIIQANREVQTGGHSQEQPERSGGHEEGQAVCFPIISL